jgi:hypothetical protein
MQTYNNAFEKQLRILIQERIDFSKEKLCSASTFMNNNAGYSYEAGIIAGLREVFELCDEANKKLGNA